MLFDQRDRGLDIVERQDHGELENVLGSAVMERNRSRRLIRPSRRLVGAARNQHVLAGAVISAFELGDLVAAGICARQPNDRLHALRPRRQEADSLHTRNVPDQAIDQLELALGRTEIGHAFLKRLAHRANDRRMSVTVNE